MPPKVSRYSPGNLQGPRTKLTWITSTGKSNVATLFGLLRGLMTLLLTTHEPPSSTATYKQNELERRSTASRLSLRRPRPPPKACCPASFAACIVPRFACAFSGFLNPQSLEFGIFTSDLQASWGFLRVIPCQTRVGLARKP